MGQAAGQSFPISKLGLHRFAVAHLLDQIWAFAGGGAVYCQRCPSPRPPEKGVGDVEGV